MIREAIELLVSGRPLTPTTCSGVMEEIMGGKEM